MADLAVKLTFHAESFGDNHTFNQTIFNTVLAFAKNGTMNIKTGMAARAMRQAVEKKRDPKIDDGIGRVITSQGETALYLSQSLVFTL